jgi:hypothetical protein
MGIVLGRFGKRMRQSHRLPKKPIVRKIEALKFEASILADSS